MVRQMTILVVDDQWVNREMIKKVLSTRYRILEAENGQVALDILQKGNDVSLVLLDMVMPVMDGMHFLMALRENEIHDLPVIAITADQQPDIEQKALDLGVWDFVRKPFHMNILTRRVENVLSHSRLHDLELLTQAHNYDSLTGLYSRSFFVQEVRKLIEEQPDLEFVFVHIDVDHFALYNSSFGDQEGDALIQWIAKEILSTCEANPLARFCHITADRFLVCLPYIHQELMDEVKHIVDALQHYKEDFLIEPRFGIYISSDPSLTVEQRMARALLAAREIKHQYGKNYHIFDETMEQQIRNEMDITNEMKSALESGQFVPYLQPQYDLVEKRFSGAEVLVRWVHPTRGLIPPGKFIPVFEHNGFIAKLDYHMWESACKLLRKWMDEGYSPNPISVNVSRASLYSPLLYQQMMDLTSRYQIDPAYLHIEITESVMMDNPKQMRETIHKLRQSGFLLEMDDFGSGYSSLNTLKDMEFDILKLDMAFLPKDPNDYKSEAIIRAILMTTNKMNLPVIAEGVETKEHLEMLDQADCRYIQGYYFSRPIPADEYEEKYVKGQA